MGNLTTALTFVLTMNVLLFLAQAAVIELNPSNTEGFYNSEGSMIDGFNDGNTSDPRLNKDRIISSLPEAEGSVSPETGNFFTDTFSSIKRWFTGLPGLNYIYGIVMAPYNMLKAMHLPGAFVFAIGSFWYGLTVFLIIAFFWGKE